MINWEWVVGGLYDHGRIRPDVLKSSQTIAADGGTLVVHTTVERFEKEEGASRRNSFFAIGDPSNPDAAVWLEELKFPRNYGERNFWYWMDADSQGYADLAHGLIKLFGDPPSELAAYGTLLCVCHVWRREGSAVTDQAVRDVADWHIANAHPRYGVLVAGEELAGAVFGRVAGLTVMPADGRRTWLWRSKSPNKPLPSCEPEHDDLAAGARGFAEALAANLTNLRGEVGMSIEEFAASADVPAKFIASVEAAEVIPAIEQLGRVAAMVELPLRELFNTPDDILDDTFGPGGLDEAMFGSGDRDDVELERAALEHLERRAMNMVAPILMEAKRKDVRQLARELVTQVEIAGDDAAMAMAVLQRAIGLDPCCVPAYILLGSHTEPAQRILVYRRAISAAVAMLEARELADFKEPTQAQTEYLFARQELGRALLGVGDFTEAALHLRELLNHGYNREWSSAYLGTALLMQGDVEQFLELEAECSSMGPGWRFVTLLGNAVSAGPEAVISQVEALYERFPHLVRALAGSSIDMQRCRQDREVHRALVLGGTVLLHMTSLHQVIKAWVYQRSGRA